MIIKRSSCKYTNSEDIANEVKKELELVEELKPIEGINKKLTDDEEKLIEFLRKNKKEVSEEIERCLRTETIFKGYNNLKHILGLLNPNCIDLSVFHNEESLGYIEKAAAKDNIIIQGNSDSGKTTILQSVLDLLDPSDVCIYEIQQRYTGSCKSLFIVPHSHPPRYT